MRFQWLMLCVLADVWGSTFAQDESEILAFNDAWVSYNEAVEASDADLQIRSSRNLLDAAWLVLEESDERLPLVIMIHGKALTDGGRNREAQTVLERALEVAVDIHGKKSPKLVPILSRLAEAHNEYQDPDMRKYYGQAKGILKRDSGEDSEAYASFLLAAGADLLSSGDVSASKRYMRIAHEIFQSMGSARDFQTGMAAFYLGKIEFSRQNFKVSTSYLLDGLAAFQSDDETSIQYQLYTRALLVQAYEHRGKSDLATEHCVAIGQVSKLRTDKDYQPLFRMAPTYPRQMLSRGAEGFVDVAFTIDESGFIQNPEVFERGGSGGREFEKAAIEAVKRFRYAPRFENGEAVTVDNVKTRISFEID